MSALFNLSRRCIQLEGARRASKQLFRGYALKSDKVKCLDLCIYFTSTLKGPAKKKKKELYLISPKAEQCVRYIVALS